MGLFDLGSGNVSQKLFLLRENYKAEIPLCNIKSHFVVKRKGNSNIAWPFVPSKRISVKIGGRYKGEYYMVSDRTGEPIDPCNPECKDWRGDKLIEKIQAIALEEHNTVVSRKTETVMDRATIPLAWAVGFFVFLLALGTFFRLFASRYGG